MSTSRTSLMAELLGFYRAALSTSSTSEARLLRKVATLQRKLAVADEEKDRYENLYCGANDDAVAWRERLRVADEEIARLKAAPPRPPTESESWELVKARRTITDQAQALGQANKDRDTWALRCEAAENLLRGYFYGTGGTDTAETLKQRTRLHFRSVGEGS